MGTGTRSVGARGTSAKPRIGEVFHETPTKVYGEKTKKEEDKKNDSKDYGNGRGSVGIRVWVDGDCRHWPPCWMAGDVYSGLVGREF